jgi:hypothetical protein
LREDKYRHARAPKKKVNPTVVHVNMNGKRREGKRREGKRREEKKGAANATPG